MTSLSPSHLDVIEVRDALLELKALAGEAVTAGRTSIDPASPTIAAVPSAWSTSAWPCNLASATASLTVSGCISHGADNHRTCRRWRIGRRRAFAMAPNPVQRHGEQSSGPTPPPAPPRESYRVASRMKSRSSLSST